MDNLTFNEMLLGVTILIVGVASFVGWLHQRTASPYGRRRALWLLMLSLICMLILILFFIPQLLG